VAAGAKRLRMGDPFASDRTEEVLSAVISALQSRQVGKLSEEESRFLSELAGRSDEAGRRVKALAMVLVERLVDKSFTVLGARVAGRLLALERVMVPDLVEAVIEMSGNQGGPPGMAATQCLKKVAGSVRVVLGRGQDELLEDLEDVITDEASQGLSDADLVLAVAKGVVCYVKMDREASLGLTMDAAKAREQWKTEMRLFVLKGGLGSWPEELKLLRGKWAKTKEDDKPVAFVKPAAFPKKTAKDFPHCAPFQHGKCTGTSTATCPQGKKHEIEKCRRSYPSGGKCSFGDDCHFGHP